MRTFDKLGNIDTHRYNLPFAELSTLELWFAARMPWLVLGASVFGTKIPSTKRVIIFEQDTDASWQNINLFKALPSLDLIVDDEGEYEGDHRDESGDSQPRPPVQLVLVGTCGCLFVYLKCRALKSIRSS